MSNISSAQKILSVQNTESTNLDIDNYTIDELVTILNISEPTEENIIKADVMYGDTGQVDLGYYCYKRGIPFSKYKVITKVLGQKVEKKYGDKIVNIEV